MKTINCKGLTSRQLLAQLQAMNPNEQVHIIYWNRNEQTLLVSKAIFETKRLIEEEALMRF